MKSKLKVHTMSQTVEWETPQKLFDELDSEFHFTLDPCADFGNAKCKQYGFTSISTKKRK